MPYGTAERVDCTVAEQYNVLPLRGESTLSTERQFSLGIGIVIEGIIRRTRQILNSQKFHQLFGFRGPYTGNFGPDSGHI